MSSRSCWPYTLAMAPVLSLILVLFAAGSGSSPEEDPKVITFTDSMGKEVTLHGFVRERSGGIIEITLDQPWADKPDKVHKKLSDVTIVNEIVGERPRRLAREAEEADPPRVLLDPELHASKEGYALRSEFELARQVEGRVMEQRIEQRQDWFDAASQAVSAEQEIPALDEQAEPGAPVASSPLRARILQVILIVVAAAVILVIAKLTLL